MSPTNHATNPQEDAVAGPTKSRDHKHKQILVFSGSFFTLLLSSSDLAMNPLLPFAAARCHNLAITLVVTAVLPILLGTQPCYGYSNPGLRVRVCQNKACCKQYENPLDLVENLQILLVDGQHADVATGSAKDVVIEPSSCLCHCDAGPNIEIEWNAKREVVSHVKDWHQVVARLDSETNDSVPPVLRAACLVLNKAKLAPINQQEKLLCSVISKLQEEDLQNSAAIALAFAMRAAYLVESGGDPSDTIEDCARCLAIPSATAQARRLAFRAWADVEERLGNYDEAVSVLRQWAQSQPSCATKIQKEILRLLSLSTT